VLGEVRTVGTVGPWPLRVLAVLLTVAVLDVSLRAIRERSAVLRHLVPAAAANLMLMGFYWAAVYPAAGGKAVKPLSALVLVGAGTISAVVLGGAFPFLVARRCRRADGNESDDRAML
jgi:hypothetical protein